MILLGYLLPSIAWALFILLLYSLPGNDLPVLHWMDVFSFDKVLHALFFALLCLFLSTALKRQQKFWLLRKHGIQVAIVCSIVYGTLLELVQGAFFEGRESDVYDWLANTLGVFVGWIMFRFIYRGLLL